MNNIYNEVNRIKNMRDDNGKLSLLYKWGIDVKLLSKTYKDEYLKEFPELKEEKINSIVMKKVLEELKDIDTSAYSWLDVEHLKNAKTHIRNGCYAKYQLKELDEIYVDEAILEYIKNNCSDIKLKSTNNKEKVIPINICKLLFTMYIWCRLLKSSIVKPRSDWKTFKFNANIETAKLNKDYEPMIKYLCDNNLIYEDLVATTNDHYGVKSYSLNFGIKSYNNDVIEIEKEDDYNSYINRIIKAGRKSMEYNDCYKVAYTDIDISECKIEFKSNGRINYKPANLYIYAQERRNIDILKGIPENRIFKVIEPTGNLLTLKGPEEYTTELCNSHRYIDDLHNPGLYIHKYIDGEVECEGKDCGIKLPKIKENKLNGKYMCRKCQYKLKNEANIKTKLEEYNKINNGGRWEFTAECPYCGTNIKVKEDDPNWKEYNLGVLGCHNCNKKYGITKLEDGSDTKYDISMTCRDCGTEATLADNTVNYWDIRKGKIDFLCKTCKHKYQVRAARSKISTNYWEEWNKEKAKRKEKMVKETSVKIDGPLNFDIDECFPPEIMDKLKDILEELED